MLTKKLFWVVVLFIVFALTTTLISYGSDWNLKEAAKPYEGTKISFLTIAWVDAMRQLANEFTEVTGIKVDVSQLQHQSLYEQLMLDFRLGSASIDIFTPVGYNMREFVEPGYILNLEPYINNLNLADPNYDWDDFVGPVAQFIIFGGDRFAFPLRSSVMYLYYRTDLFEEYAAKFESVCGYKLQPPQTWEEYNEIAKFFTETEWQTPGGTRGYGTAEHGKKEFSMYYLFKQRYTGVVKAETGNTVNIIDENNNPTFNNQYGIKAIKQWKESLEYSPPGVLQTGNAETKEFFAKGITAMTLQWGSLLGLLVDSPVKDDFAIAVLPGQVPEGGIPPVAINAGSKNAEAAFLFAQWLTNKQNDIRLFEIAGIEPVRRSSFMSNTYKVFNPFTDVVLDSLEKAVSLPVNQEFTELETATMEELHPFLLGQKTAEEAIEQLEKKFIEILQGE